MIGAERWEMLPVYKKRDGHGRHGSAQQPQPSLTLIQGGSVRVRPVAEIITREGDCDTLWGTRREIAMGLIKDLLDLGSQALAGFKE